MTDAAPTHRSTARVATPRASGLLQQLCKHFAHKLPVEFTPQAGRIAFPYGACELSAGAEELVMTATAADGAALARVEDVIARHLLRFAFRDPPRIVWDGARGDG